MYLVNRAALQLIIKKPFLEWVNSIGKFNISIESVNRENHIYLIPEHDTDEELKEIIEDIYCDICEVELSSFCRDMTLWPEISFQNFRDWFDIKVHSMVLNSNEDELIEEEWL